MGFFEQWIDRKRRKELDHINQQLEELKRKGPDFNKKTTDSPVVLMKGSGSFMPFFLILCLIIMIGLLIFSSMKLSKLKDQAVEKEVTIASLRQELSNVSTTISSLEEQLSAKQSTESELGEKYGKLQEELLTLQLDYDDLNTTYTQKNAEVTVLRNELDEKEALLTEIENCIDNNSISNKETCI